MEEKKAEQETRTYAVASKVKDYMSALGFRTSGDLIDALNVKVEEMLTLAVARCKSNGRQTVRADDL